MTGMGWSRKEEITSQFDSDPELKSAWTKLREETRKAMSRFQRNGGGERSGEGGFGHQVAHVHFS